MAPVSGEFDLAGLDGDEGGKSLGRQWAFRAEDEGGDVGGVGGGGDGELVEMPEGTAALVLDGGSEEEGGAGLVAVSGHGIACGCGLVSTVHARAGEPEVMTLSSAEAETQRRRPRGVLDFQCRAQAHCLHRFTSTLDYPPALLRKALGRFNDKPRQLQS